MIVVNKEQKYIKLGNALSKYDAPHFKLENVKAKAEKGPLFARNLIKCGKFAGTDTILDVFGSGN